MKDFANIKLEILDLNVNATPDMFINRSGITFSKKVLETLNCRANVQYCLDAEHRVFAIWCCRSNDTNAFAFSKSKSEQTSALSCSNKNLLGTVKALMSSAYDPIMRYKVTGQFDHESRTMWFDLDETEQEEFRSAKIE